MQYYRLYSLPFLHKHETESTFNKVIVRPVSPPIHYLSLRSRKDEEKATHPDPIFTAIIVSTFSITPRRRRYGGGDGPLTPHRSDHQHPLKAPREIFGELCLSNPNIVLVKKTPLLEEPFMRKCTKVDVCVLNFDGVCKNLDFSLYVNDDEKNIEMLPSKWDLVCFVSETGFYACNPSTQVMMKLPEASCCTSGEVNAGMGYIKERDEYVLMHLFDRSLDIHVDYDIGCEVLRLRDGADCTWTVLDANCPYVVRGWGVLVGNMFYWMIWDEYNQPGDEAIVSFDLEKEEFGTVSPPDGCFDPNGAWSLVELGGRLCLVDNVTRPLTMDIWVLKDIENHKWVREYSIQMNGYANDMLNFIVPLDYRDGKILMDAKQESLDYYDVKKKHIKRMDHLIAGEWNWLRLYTESFFYLGSK